MQLFQPIRFFLATRGRKIYRTPLLILKYRIKIDFRQKFMVPVIFEPRTLPLISDAQIYVTGLNEKYLFSSTNMGKIVDKSST